MSADERTSAVCARPQDIRVMAWVKPFAAFKRNVSVAYAWEPVLVKAGRKPVVKPGMTCMTSEPTNAASRPENKLAVALAVREAMREHRKGKPIAFRAQSRPLDKDGWPARWSDPTYLGDGPVGRMSEPTFAARKSV